MAFDVKDCIYDGKGKFSLKKYKTSAKVDDDLREHYEKLTAKNTERMAELQDKLYAEGKEGLVILIQAMDAAGKDSTIKHVMSGVNPQGCVVHSFKQPSKEELGHGYLWRASQHLPQRGYIGLFNRSYYEDVLVVKVHNMQTGYAMPKRCTTMKPDKFFKQRYQQITNFEDYLYENGYRVVKIFLNVSPDEQKERFLARIEDESKNWKFSASDMKERELWKDYQKAYEDAIGNTSTKNAPWYIIPADQKWYARYLVSKAIVRVLRQINPKYPEMPDDQKANLASCKAALESEGKDDVVPDSPEELAAAAKAKEAKAQEAKEQKAAKKAAHDKAVEAAKAEAQANLKGSKKKKAVKK